MRTHTVALVAFSLALVGCARLPMPAGSSVPYTGSEASDAREAIEGVIGPVGACLDGGTVFVPASLDAFSEACGTDDPRNTLGCMLSVESGSPHAFPGSFALVVRPDIASDAVGRSRILMHEARHRASECVTGDPDVDHVGALFE